MAQLYQESIPNLTENLPYEEVQEHVASLGSIFDLIVEQGNDHFKGASLHTSRLLIGPFYDSNNAGVRSLQGVAYAEDGSVEGKMIFTGSRNDESEKFSWQLTKYPVNSVEPPTEEAVRLAEKYVVPLASIWRTLPPEAQGSYLKQFVRQREEVAPRQSITKSMARFIIGLGRA
jgi:hypothetical protein